MTSIIIYTTPDKLLHKQGKLKDDIDESPTNEYYWELNNTPKKLEWEDVIFFATKGFIKGYFQITEIDYGKIYFDARTWKEIKQIPTKSFQGFKYADKVKELRFK